MPTLVRYLVKKVGRDGNPRYFWQPSAELRAQGWRPQRVPEAWISYRNHSALFEAAAEEARAINAEVDRGRLGQRASGDEPRYLYVLHRGDGLRKIGVTAKPLERQRVLRNSSGSALHLELLLWSTSPMTLERRIHALLSDRRARGEWFDVSWPEAFDALNLALQS